MLRRIRVAALALLAACTTTPSEVAPDAAISITGSVSRQDGTPAADVPVTVVRHEGVAEALTAVVSLGVTCLGDGKQLNVCRGGRHAETGDDGRFIVTLKGADTQGFLGDASTLEATAILPRGRDEVAGPAATLRFLVQTERISLPLRVWEPSIEAVAGPASATVTWTEIPAAVIPAEINTSAARTAVVFERGAGEIVWTTPGRSEAATFDPRLLEDSKGSVSVVAQWAAHTVPDERGRTIELLLRSGRPGYRSRAGRPPSRGMPCALRLPDGSLVSRAPCPLTDGAFDAPMGPQPCEEGRQCVRSNEVVVDWKRPRQIGLIVVRGCSAACKVDTSEDGTNWRLAATTAAGDVAIDTIEGARARFVRITSDDIEALREVSMWEPGAPSGAPAVSILAEVGGRSIPLIDRSDRRERRVPIAIAGLLAALVAGMLLPVSLQRRTG